MTLRRGAAGFTLMELMIVVALIAVISAIAVPMIGNTLANFKISGDVRGVSNSLALAKMRAASDFSRVRLYIDQSAKTFQIQVSDKTSLTPVCCWKTEGGLTYLNGSTSLSFGVVSTPPPNADGSTIGTGALQCQDNSGNNIANTSCVIFNSRGVPIDNTVTGAPYAKYAVYLTDGTAVYAVTVAATGITRVWRTVPTSTPSWNQQ